MRFSLFSRLHWILGILIIGTGLTITGVASRWLQEDKTNVLQELTVQVSASGSRQLTERIRNSLNRIRNESKDLNFTLAKRAASQGWDYSTVTEGVVKIDRLKEALNISDLKFDENFLNTIAGSKGEPLMLIAHLVQGRSAQDADARLQVTIEPVSRWDDLVRPFKGAFTSLFFVDERGHTFLHPNETYIGHVLNQNAAVQSVMTANRRLFSGSLKNDTGDALFVSYERVPKTNLISVSTVSLKTAYGSSKIMIFFIMAAMSILACVVFFVCRMRWKTMADAHSLPPPLPEPMTTQQHENDPALPGAIDLNRASESFDNENDEAGTLAQKSTSASSQKLSQVDVDERALQPLASSRVPSAPVLDQERIRRVARLEAIESLGRKLAKEFQGAIAATLGHVQLVKGKIEGREALKHVEFIDREVRQIKETLDRMGRMGVYQTLELSTAKPLEVLSDILNDAEVTTARWSVNIRKNFYPVGDFRINESEFKKAINELILNRAQAMEHARGRELVRDLVVTVEPFENKVRIRIEDHAAPLSSETAQRFFDFGERISPLQAPFDLRLPTVGAVLANHGATFRVNPATAQDGNGNCIVIELPIFFEDKKGRADSLQAESTAVLEKEQVSLSPEVRDLNFVENAPAEPVAKTVRSVKLWSLPTENQAEVSASDLPAAPRAPAKHPTESDEEGPLAGFSVKVRRPRMTL